MTSESYAQTRFSLPGERPEGALIATAPHVDITADLRLHYLPRRADDGLKHGFDLCAVLFHTCSGETADQWTDPALEVLVVARGWAGFDGVRHLYLGENGYFNYPDMLVLAALMQQLRKLEERYCSEYEQSDILCS